MLFSASREAPGGPPGAARLIVLAIAPVAILAVTRAMGPAMPGLFFLAAFAVSTAGYFWGVLAGLVEGLCLALLLTPTVGLVDIHAITSAPIHWWRVGLFFVVIGLAAGAASHRLRRRLADERAEREELALLHARSLTTFANLVAERDQPTAHHCERVAANVRTLGRHHGLDGSALDALYWAGLLHDLGKISTPASILLKEGTLTADEYAVIKLHPDKGADVLLDISARFREIAEGIRSHHERWDGGGYPAGLAGTDIPLFGRLLAVADVYEAMTSPRPYRAPLPPQQVLRHLHAGAGTAFDPDVVRLFGDLHARGLLRSYDRERPPPVLHEPSATPAPSVRLPLAVPARDHGPRQGYSSGLARDTEPPLTTPDPNRRGALPAESV